MVSVEEARLLIRAALPEPRTEEIALSKALGRVCAAEISCPIALPSFDNSAMDGFALRSADAVGASPNRPVKLNVVSDVLAGNPSGVLAPGECVRIMTGAPMPATADTVIAFEEARAKNGFLVLEHPVPPGRNVRSAGEEIQAGQRALGAGGVLNPGTIGFLAGLGIARVRVFRRPKVAVLSTGSELVDAGRRLGTGKIYDSNGPMLRAALQEAGIRPVSVRRVQDRPVALRLAFAAALSNADVLLISGGISAGKADYAKETLNRLGIETVFWGVSQKPGKPFYFGRKGTTLVFGLPGNPASVFTCFYEYAYPALRRLCGFSDKELVSESLPLTAPFKTAGRKSLFLKSRRRREPDASVELLANQGSHMLSPLREADSFVVIPEGTESVSAGERVLVHALPYARNLT